MKCCKTDSLQGFKLLEEGKLLICLNHPGIPKVYDIEQDEEYICLVEEYVRGETLDTFIRRQDEIPKEITEKVGKSLCEILIYLRENDIGIIKHRDIKPEHIIFTDEGIKLIDYGNATMNPSEALFYGNKGDLDLAPGSDVDCEAVRRIVIQMLKKSSDPKAHDLIKIIKRTDCNMPEDFLRIFTKERTGKIGVNVDGEESHLKKKIAVCGSERRIGATHFSIALEVYLRQMGMNALYVEKNEGKSMWKMARAMDMNTKKDGLYIGDSFCGVPMYGTGVVPTKMQADVFIEDYGTGGIPEDADLVVLVVGARPWEMAESKGAIEKIAKAENVLVVCMNGDNWGAVKLAKETGKRVFCYPLDADPFHMNEHKRKFFAELLKERGEYSHKANDNCSGRHKQWLRGNAPFNSFGKLPGFRKR